MAAFPFVHMCIMCLMAFVAAQRPFPSEAWSDSTGASFSEGNVITCTWGVLCRHGFSRSGPDEICESSFECTPAEVAVARPPLEPAQVPPVPPTEPGPVLPVPVSPAMGNTSNVSGHPSHSVADAKPAKSPEASNASDASAPHEVPPAKPEMANGTMPHMPSNSSELNNASGLIKSSGASNVAPRPSLRGSGGKGGVAEKPEEKPQGPRRLHSRSYGHKIFCQCGVVCQWGFRMEGAKKICNGPLYCSSCMPMQMGGVSVGGV
mmetsp:Transcript_50145/g.82587  ORF Transcript_50145/g.82587 Transcript_50145/m.82587 type:complete len:263 (+) Transcript_50145:55-843(+)